MENIVKQFLVLFLVATISCVIAQESAIKATVKKSNPSAESQNDGSLEITKIEGGVPPYQIHWFGFQIRNEESQKIEQLRPGRYVLFIQDKEKSSIKLEFTIECCR